MILHEELNALANEIEQSDGIALMLPGGEAKMWSWFALSLSAGDLP